MPDFIHLPEPMSPPDCDLRGNQWLPFHGARLFSSDFDATASDAVFRAFMYLIWAAWNQVPAGSLPNIPAVLCKLSGCGRDLAAWEALRAGGVLHGFILCQDDRLYHPFLSAEAIKSFDARLKADKKREADRERLRLWREAKEKKRTTSQSGNVFQGHIETPVETSKTRPNQTRLLIPTKLPRDSDLNVPMIPRLTYPWSGASLAENFVAFTMCWRQPFSADFVRVLRMLSPERLRRWAL